MSYTEHTWVDGETITAAKMNNIEEGIAEAAQSGGGDKYSEYDYVITKIGSSGTATLVKGVFSDIYDKLQNEEIVCGLYAEVGTPGIYHDNDCYYTLLIHTNYYSSMDGIMGHGFCYDNVNTPRVLSISWERTGTITVSKN